MRINDKETLALADAAKSVMAENAKDYKPNRGGKGHDDFIDLHSIDKEKRRGSSPLTEKDIEEANEFTKAAAKAAVAGDDEFEFDGKTYPAEMDVDVAKKILGESVSINEAIDFSKVKDDQLKAWLDRFRSTKGNSPQIARRLPALHIQSYHPPVPILLRKKKLELVPCCK